MFWDQFPVIKDEIIKFEEYLQGLLISREALIEEAISDLAQAGGKRIRPALVIAAAHYGSEYQQDKAWNIAAAIEMMHMATLIHDDIIDDSNLRRGQATVQSKYGKDVAVFTGDYLFTLTFDVLSGTASGEQLKKVADVIKQICEGEIKQHQERYQLNVSYKDYFRRIKRKTAILFEGSCALGAGIAGLDKSQINDLAHYGRYLGMAFQLVDDLLDFIQSTDELGKPDSNDFTQGIYTLPVLYVIKESNAGDRLRELLENPVINRKEINKIVKEEGGLDYTFDLARDYIKKAEDKLAKLPDNPYQEVLIGLTTKVINRSY